jgi:hypothetical protein
MIRPAKRIASSLFLVVALAAGPQAGSAPGLQLPGAKLADAAGHATAGLEGLNETQKARVLQLLDSVGVSATSLQGKKWPRRRQAYLAVNRDSSASEENLRYQVFAFDLSEPKIRLSAAMGEPRKLSRRDGLKGFDFAAYQIKPGEYAFGLRYMRMRSYSAGVANLEGMVLYRIQGSEIREILDVTTSFESDLAGEWNEDGTRGRNGNLGTAVLQVSKSKTGGYFDWIKKADNGKSAALTWDGSGYVLQGADPFPTDELDIFDVE